MGQTLTHGVYLPAEGERNCYSGLAANWQLLDNSVGTIAEHTTALAGKAPAVHTHTKSDVTDLFNSANTWSGDNTYEATINYQSSYTLGNPPQSTTAQIVLKITDTAGTNYLSQIAAYQDSAATGLRFTIRDKFDSNGFSPSGNNRNKYFSLLQNTSNQGYFKWDGYIDNSLSPLANNTYDLGTSTTKWKTFNGINPGALSLPDNTREEPIDRTNWVYTYNAANIYYPPEDGWLAVACSGSDYIQIEGDAGWGITLSKGYDGFCTGIIPVKKNKRVQIRIRETSSGSVVVRKASFYPGTGDPSFTVTSSS